VIECFDTVGWVTERVSGKKAHQPVEACNVYYCRFSSKTSGKRTLGYQLRKVYLDNGH